MGWAIERYSHEYRKPRGVYLSIDRPEEIEQSFLNFGADPNEIDLIVATDAEQILGIGDWGRGRHQHLHRQAHCVHRGGGHRSHPGDSRDARRGHRP